QGIRFSGTRSEDLVGQVSSIVDLLTKKVGATPVSKELRDAVAAVKAFRSQYEAATEVGDPEKISEAAKMVAVYGQMTAQHVSVVAGASPELRLIRDNLLERAQELRTLAESSPAVLKPFEQGDIPQADSDKTKFALQSQALRRSRQLTETLEQQEVRLRSLQEQSHSRLQTIEDRLSNLDASAKAQIEKVESAYQTALLDLQAKQKEIDELLGKVSGRAIAGDYEKSAKDERTMADWLRYGSLACMLLIATILGYTFWETTATTFSWERSAFRVLVAVFLSAPAAYLARESGKHREQQYTHLQTSLDLKALSPYLASLPEDSQHKIKADVASRIFSNRDFSRVSSDSYPINTQELLVKIIDKVDLRRSEKNTGG
ncbi:hypothetical protein, partial [Amphibiibacter pelophylacis]